MKKLVKFENGKYGIRIGVWLTGYKFKDFENPEYTWSMGSEHFEDCQTTLENAKRIMGQKHLKYKVINY